MSHVASAVIVEERAPAEKTRIHYRPDIDGMRGTAAILGVGFHARMPGFEGAFVGLDMFFVVSGFVIANLLLGEYQRTGGIRWMGFYARRVRRLIPGKAVMIVGVLVLSSFLLAPTGAQQETAKSAAAEALFVSNLYFMQSDDISYFNHQPGTGVLLQMWSLSVEEQFYLAMPLLILLAVGAARVLRLDVRRLLLPTTLLLAVASCALAVALAEEHPREAYYLTPSRAYEFLLGVALALITSRIAVRATFRAVMGVAGAVLLAYTVWRPLPHEAYPEYWALVPCLATALLIWGGTGGMTAVSKLLAAKPLVALGLVSYGWYLWHWPLLVLAESVNLAPPPVWVRAVLAYGAGLLLATLSYFFVEKRFYSRSGTERTKLTWGSGRVVVAGVTTMVVLAGFGGIGLAVAKLQAGSDRWTEVAAELGDTPKLPAYCLDGEEPIQQRPVTCRLNDWEPTRGTVVLWGDSSAWMYIPALEAAAEGHDVNLVAFNMGGCPPFDPGRRRGAACTQGNARAMHLIEKWQRRGHGLRVVLGADWETYRGADPIPLLDARGANDDHLGYVEAMTPLFNEGAPQLFRELRQLGVGVDLLGPLPEMERIVPLCTTGARPFSCDLPRSRVDTSFGDTWQWLRQQATVLGDETRIIDVTGEFCDRRVCHAQVDGVLTYFDDRHFSATFARRLAPYLEPSVEDAEEGDDPGTAPARPAVAAVTGG